MFQNIKNSKINKNNYTCTIKAFKIILAINKNNQNQCFHCLIYRALNVNGSGVYEI